MMTDRQNDNAPLDGRTILVAEDDPAGRTLIRTLLERAGAAVSVAADGREAIERVEGETPDLVFLDMQMPGVDGFEAAESLRERGYDGPVVALTAASGVEARDAARAAGCDRYVTKPVDREGLIKAVRTWIDEPAADDREGEQRPAAPAEPERIVSELADDPEIAEIIPEFVESLDGQLRAIRQAVSGKSFDDVRRAAHKLKGAGGGYGYPVLTDVAAAVEKHAKAGDADALSGAMEHLTAVCCGIRAGCPVAGA